MKIDIRMICLCENCFCCESNFVPALKNSSKILCFILAEAPGATEIVKKIPLCGAAGTKLDKLLQQAQINKASLYITNAVKCRPPENRKPTFEEMQRCSNKVIEELNESQSHKILVLGATALTSIRYIFGIDDKRTIMQCAYTTQNITLQDKVFQLYIAPHPAFLLYKKSHTDEEKFILLLKSLLYAS